MGALGKNCKKLKKFSCGSCLFGAKVMNAFLDNCFNLQELVLIGVNPSSISLEAIASNCQKLERLALCGNEGIEAFAWGCPNLIKIKVKKCRNVMGEVGDWLRARRGSSVVNLDVCAVEVENVDASASDGAQEDVTDLPTITSDVAVAQPESLAASANGRGSGFRTRFGIFGGRGLVSSTFRKWSIGNRSSNVGLFAREKKQLQRCNQTCESKHEKPKKQLQR
ncbi:Leucine-rich repeat, cysteine-containing subtype [Artemisia annua]|uniref:Leucine-rich repeat, cysteine-containing subtype n=1 Tax=Artemisia annua TaxID=35608 RepID=A0A2U1KC32_ARTAN|nr:Leucine-rich repeat, cysteine-containing subtype [Artemisia annua]